jgi:hypothetical protein
VCFLGEDALNCHIIDRAIAPQLGLLHENVGIGGLKRLVSRHIDADPRSLASEGAMRETKRPGSTIFRAK